MIELLELDLALINVIDPNNRYIDFLTATAISPKTVTEAYNSVVKATSKEFDLLKLKTLYESVFKYRTKSYQEIQNFYKNNFNYNIGFIRTD